MSDSTVIGRTAVHSQGSSISRTNSRFGGGSLLSQNASSVMLSPNLALLSNKAARQSSWSLAAWVAYGLNSTASTSLSPTFTHRLLHYSDPSSNTSTALSWQVVNSYPQLVLSTSLDNNPATTVLQSQTSLSRGHWHHLAVSVDTNALTSSHLMQVTLFVNGSTTEHFHVMADSYQLPTTSYVWTVSDFVTPTCGFAAGTPCGVSHANASVDELHVLSSALQPSQVQAVMQSNVVAAASSPTAAAGASAVNHWCFDVLEGGIGAWVIPDLVGNSPLTVVPTVSSSLLTSAAVVSTIDSRFGPGSYVSSTGSNTSQLTGYFNQSIVDFTGGWSLSFWYQPYMPAAGSVLQTVYSDQQSDNEWSFEVQLLTAVTSTSLSVEVASSLHLSDSSVWTCTLTWSQAKTLYVPWNMYSVVWSPSGSTVGCVVSLNSTAQSSSYSWNINGRTPMVITNLTGVNTLANTPNTTLYNGFTQQLSAQPQFSPINGHLDELWIFDGSLSAAQLADLYNVNAPFTVYAGFAPGYDYVYQLNSFTTSLALNNTDVMAGTYDPAGVTNTGATLDGVQLDSTESTSNTSAVAGRSITLYGNITVHGLDFTFEAGNNMIGVWPPEQQLNCTDNSPALSSSVQSSTQSFCYQFSQSLEYLPPIFVTQSPTSYELLNVYYMSNTASTAGILQMSSLILQLLDWQQFSIPGETDANQTVVGNLTTNIPGASQQNVTVTNQTAQASILRVSSATTAGTVTQSQVPSPQLQYVTKHVMPGVLRKMRRTTRIVHPSALMTSLSAQAVNEPQSAALATGLATQLSTSNASASYCTDIRSETDTDPNNEGVDGAVQVNWYNTTVLTCYQSGVGPVASFMYESGQTDHNTQDFSVQTSKQSSGGLQPESVSGSSIPVSVSATPSGSQLRQVSAVQSGSALNTLVVDPSGSLFVLTHGLQNNSNTLTAPLTQLSLLSSSLTEPFVSNVTQTAAFQISWSRKSSVPAGGCKPGSGAICSCMWMVNVWGGVQQWCDSSIVSSNMPSRWQSSAWSTVVDPTSDFQATTVRVRSAVSAAANCTYSFNASCIHAVAIDSFGLLHAAVLNSSGLWQWDVINVDANSFPVVDFTFYSDAAPSDLNNDGLEEVEERSLMLGVVYSTGQLSRLYVRSTRVPLSPLAVNATGAYQTSVFTYAGRLDGFPVMNRLRAWNVGAGMMVHGYHFDATQQSAPVYVLSETHQLLLSAWLPSSGAYSYYQPLADNVVHHMAYTLQVQGAAVHGVLFVDHKGALSCLEHSAAELQRFSYTVFANSTSPQLSSSLTALNGLVACSSSASGTTPSCTAADHKKASKAIFRRLHAASTDSSSTGTSSTIVTATTDDQLLTLYRPTAASVSRGNSGTSTCNWQTAAQQPLRMLSQARQMQQQRGLLGVAPTTMVDGLSTGNGTLGPQRRRLLQSPIVNTGGTSDIAFLTELEMIDEESDDVANDGSQLAYGGAVQMGISLTSYASSGGRVLQSFVQPTTQAGGGTLVSSPTGTQSPWSGYSAVSYTTMSTYSVQPREDTSSQIQTLLTSLISFQQLDPVTYGAYRDAVVDDSVVSVVNQLVWQRQMQPLANTVWGNATLFAWVFGAVVNMFPQSTYASSMVLAALQNNSLGADLQTAALQSAYLIECPSQALAQQATTIAHTESQGVAETALQLAASSALSVWGSSTGCNQSAAQSLGYSTAQVAAVQSAAVFYSALNNNSGTPSNTSSSGKAALKLQQFLDVPCSHTTACKNCTVQQPGCHPDVLRSALLSAIANASSVETQAQMVITLGNTNHADDAAYLVDLASDVDRDVSIRTAALWAMRRHRPSQETVQEYRYLWTVDPDERVRLAAMTGLTYMSNNHCHDLYVLRAAHYLGGTLYHGVRRPLELTAIGLFFKGRVLCAAGDQDYARLMLLSISHNVQSMAARNGPYSALSNTSHNSYLQTVTSRSSVSDATTTTAATSSSGSTGVTAGKPQANTFVSYGRSWGANKANVRFTSYGGWTFDGNGFQEDFYAKAAFMFFDYELPVALAQVTSFWSSGGSLGLHAAFTIAWFSLKDLAFQTRDIIALQRTVYLGIGIAQGNTCDLSPTQTGIFPVFDQTFIRFTFIYGLPVLNVQVSASVRGTVTINYGVLIVLPPSNTTGLSATALAAMLGSATVKATLQPTLSIVGSLQAEVSAWAVWGGVRGDFTIVAVALPATAGFNVANYSAGVSVSLNTNLLRGSVSAYYGYVSCCTCGSAMALLTQSDCSTATTLFCSQSALVYCAVVALVCVTVGFAGPSVVEAAMEAAQSPYSAGTASTSRPLSSASLSAPRPSLCHRPPIRYRSGPALAVFHSVS